MGQDPDDDPTTDLNDRLHNQLCHFLESEQWGRAHDVVRELLQRDSLSSYLHYQAGIISLQLNKYETSEHHLRTAISLNPEDPDSYQAMAYLRITQEKFLAAEEFCRKAIELAPLDPDNWVMMGDLCRVQHDRTQARICLEKARELAPESINVLRLAADLSTMKEGTSLLEADDNLTNYSRVLAKDPENESALYSSGVIYLEEKKDYEKAERLFRAALRQDPLDKDYEKALIRTFRKRDPFLRLLWLPLRAGIRLSIWGLILIPYLYFRYPEGGREIGGYLALGIFLGLLFWPITKLYEFLTVSEVHRQMGRVTLSDRPPAVLHRLPHKVRLSLFISVALLIWLLIAWLLARPSSREVLLQGAGTVAAISFLGIVLFLIFLSIRSRHREKQRAFRNAHLFRQKDLHQ